MLSAIIACGIQVLQVKERARLFSKTTVAILVLLQGSIVFITLYIARLIHLVFKFAIVSRSCHMQ